MNYIKKTIPGAFAALMLFLPIHGNAVDFGGDVKVAQVINIQKLSEQVNEIKERERKRKEVEVSEKVRGIESYTMKEIGVLVSFLLSGNAAGFDRFANALDMSRVNANKLYLGNFESESTVSELRKFINSKIGQNTFDQERVLAFEVENFGGKDVCGGVFGPFSGRVGSSSMIALLNYTNLDSWGDVGGKDKAAQQLTNSLNSFKANPGKKCSTEDVEVIQSNFKSFAKAILESRQILVADRDRIFKIIETGHEAEKAREEERERASNEKIRKVVEAKASVEREKSECMNSSKYKMWQAASYIVSRNRGIDEAKAVISREKKIAEVSGYENKNVIYQAGRQIVALEGDRDVGYAKYKEAGGKISPASAIKDSGSDPCIAMQ